MSATPYLAPTYFPPTYDPPSYFGGVVADVSPGSSVPVPSTPYCAPTYFAPGYFAPTYFDGLIVQEVITPQLGRDRACYLDAVKRILTIPEFGGAAQYGQFPPVQYGRTLEHILEGGDHSLVAVVNPLFYRVDDKYDPIVTQRKVTGSIAISARHQDAEHRQAMLDLIDAKIHNVIDGQSLFGITLPPFTAIVAGQYRDAPHPEQRLILQLEFVYDVEGFDGNDETEEPIGY